MAVAKKLKKNLIRGNEIDISVVIEEKKMYVEF